MALNIEYVKERHTGRWVALIIFILILAAAGWFGYRWYTTGNIPVDLPIVSANTAIDESDITFDQTNGHTMPSEQPRYIRIPSIDLTTTRIFPVGLDSNNLIEAPGNINDVSWYKESGTPGDGGVILMQGHSVGVSKNGAFAKLSTLKKGDIMTLERGDGQTFTYRVVENQNMSIDEVNATGMKMMGQSADPGKEALNLIGYDGTWVPRLGMFDRRTMLRAVIVDEN